MLFKYLEAIMNRTVNVRMDYIVVTDESMMSTRDGWQQIEDQQNVYVLCSELSHDVIQERLTQQLGHSKFTCLPLLGYYKKW